MTPERIRQILKAEAKLLLLEAGGVDNWSWYWESLNPEDGETYEQACSRINKLTEEEISNGNC